MQGASFWGGLASLLMVAIGWRASKWARASSFAFALGAATVALIAVGGMVSGTHNGLACPDWPTCFGSFVPEYTGGVEFEHTHRLVAAAVVGLTVGLARRLWFERAERPALWRLGVAAAALVVAQALLGALTVVLKLPPAVVTLHLAVALAFLALLVLIAWRARPGLPVAPVGISPWVALAPAAVYAQAVMGALTRHLDAGLACGPEWPLCRGVLWPFGTVAAVQIHAAHRWLAWMVAAIVCAAALHVWRRARGHRALRALALAAPVLVAVQIAFGVLSVYTWLSLWAVTVHLANGALLLGVTLSLYLVSRSPAAQPATTATLAVPLLRDLLDLTKPRITLMNLITSAGGLWLAPGELSPALAFWTLFGTALVVAGAGTLNCYLERDIDKLMERTRNRPLPAGRLQPRTALGMGLALCAAGLPILSFLVNPLTGLLAAVALVFYVCIYTPMKQASSFALMVGAVPGAMPPLMGWAAATGTMRGPGLVLFAILFLWQLPHFLALALYRKDDYRAAGLHVTPLDLGDARTRVEIVQYLLALVPVSLLLVVMRVAGVAYLAAALLLGGIFIGYGLAGLRARDERAHLRWARGLFRYSLVYLTLLFAVLVASAGT